MGLPYSSTDFGAGEPARAPVAVLAVGGVLLVSIPAELSDSQVRQMRSELGHKLTRGNWRGLVLDASGVETLDSFMTRSLRDLAVGARLMGIQTVVCGLRPEVVDTLVEMGLDLQGVPTRTDLDQALAVFTSGRRRR